MSSREVKKMNSFVMCALVVGSLATLLQPGLGETDQTTVSAAQILPVPSGTFGIGRIGYEWVDLSRTDAYSTAPQAHRDLMVYLWYPSPRGNAGEPGWYLPGAREMDADPE